MPIVKVTDFSFAKDLESKDTSWMSTVRGNPHWLAPELLNEQCGKMTEARYKKPVDVFCLGLVIVFMFIHKHGWDLFREHCRKCLRFLPLLTNLLQISEILQNHSSIFFNNIMVLFHCPKLETR